MYIFFHIDVDCFIFLFIHSFQDLFWTNTIFLNIVYIGLMIIIIIIIMIIIIKVVVVVTYANKIFMVQKILFKNISIINILSR